MSKVRFRKWFQFSFRTLLILMTVGCIGFGWHVIRVQVQRDVLAKLRDLGVSIGSYDFEPDRYRLCNAVDGRATWPPLWLVNAIGPDHFCTFESCGVHEFKTGNSSKIRNKIFAQLERLNQFERLYYPSTSDEQELGMLVGRLRHLHSLVIFEPQDPKTFFGNLNRNAIPLENIEFPDKIKDETVYALSELRSLKYIAVEAMTESQEKLLRSLLPDIEIYCHDDYPP